MSDNFTQPGGFNTYVPQLHSDLIVEFSRNPDKFPLMKYIDVRKVDKQKGLYLNMKNDGQARVVDSNDFVWADGTDSPKVIEGNDYFDFQPYTCIRRRASKTIGFLSAEQAAWDLLGQSARMLSMQLMTDRCKRVHTTLTTSGNWGANYATATTAGGGTWANATGSNPYIRKSIAYAQIAVEQATLGTVMAEELYLVMNPNTAKLVATSAEIIDYLKEQPSSVQIWEGQNQFRRYGLPENLLGCNIVVDNTVYNSALPGASASLGFTLPDNYAVLMTKQKAIQPAAGVAFSTFQLFAFEELTPELYSDTENRRYKLYVSDNTDTSFLFAPQSGYLLLVSS